MNHKTVIIGLIGFFLLIQPTNSQTWGTSKRLTFSSLQSQFPDIALDSNNHIHVVWDDNSPGNREIYYKKSTDGGTIWTTKRLTFNPGDSWYAAIAIDSNNHIHMALMDESHGLAEIYYKKSTDGGANWTTKRLTYNPGESYAPDIAVDSNNHIFFVWDDDTSGDSEIFFKKSTDSGATWTTKRLTYTSYNAWNAAMAVDSDNNIYLVWEDGTPYDSEISFAKSTDGGVNWTTQRLTFNSGYSGFPAIAVDSNNHIHVSWDDNSPGNREIYYKRSTDEGETWTTKRLSFNSGVSGSTAIATDSNDNIHVVWIDVTPGNSEIFYRRGTDNGATWGGARRLTWNLEGSEFPSVATDLSTNIHVVWHDWSPGNAEIYYKKGIQ